MIPRKDDDFTFIDSQKDHERSELAGM